MKKANAVKIGSNCENKEIGIVVHLCLVVQLGIEWDILDVLVQTLVRMV